MARDDNKARKPKAENENVNFTPEEESVNPMPDVVVKKTKPATDTPAAAPIAYNAPKASNEDLLGTLINILKQENSEEIQEIRKAILRSVLTENEIQRSRIVAPLNITEVGGYINLLTKLRQEAMVEQMLASVLGLPMRR